MPVRSSASRVCLAMARKSLLRCSRVSGMRKAAACASMASRFGVHGASWSARVYPCSRKSRSPMLPYARALIARYGIRASSPSARLETLSGGNVQRTVLARELARDVRLLIMQNPCFGLDAAAATDIRRQILRARDGGAAVLLVSEDLDEVLELSDRVLVIASGRITYETERANADRYEIGRHMTQGSARLPA